MKKIITIILGIALIGVIFLSLPGKEKFEVTQQGFASYENLKAEVLNETIINTTPMLVKKIYLKGTDGSNVPFIFRIPSNASATRKVSGILIMPGALVPKEYDNGLGTALGENDFAVMTVDQPGTGENKQKLNEFKDDLTLINEGKEPSQLLFVSDYLIGFDYLKNQENVDENKIILLGESNGGRIAIISAEILESKKIKLAGLVLISTAGYGLPETNDEKTTNFIRLIDPDYYAPYVNSKIMQFHSVYDPGIPLVQARKTFDRLTGEKEFILMQCHQHGSCDEAYLTIIRKAQKLVN